MSKNVKNPNI